MANRIDREELRQLIREALREALGEPSPLRRESVAAQPPGEASPKTPAGRSAPSPTAPRKTEGQGSARFDSGVLSEAKLIELSRAHTKILIGGDVVVTPLARDKARDMKLEIVRQKP